MKCYLVNHKYAEKGFAELPAKLASEVAINDWVEVETELGHRAFRVKGLDEKPTQEDIGKILRKLSSDEIEELQSYAESELEMLDVFKEKADKFDLELKAIEAEKTTNRDRVIFYFTAPDRVDFRRLVKDLAATFHCLIRLQQISTRTAAMIKGGLGPCGKGICCRKIKGANMGEVGSGLMQNQGLKGVDSNKLSGICGKLVCCLKYEREQYQEMLKDFPRKGDKIKVDEEGEGEVIDINPLKKTILVKLENKKIKEIKI